MNRIRTLRGFTMVEMLIVIAVLSVVLTIGIPRLTEVMDSTRAKRAADTISAFLINAKSEAIKRNTTVRVVFTTTADSWCAGMTTADTCDCTAGTCTLDNVPRILDGASFKDVVLNNPESGGAFSFTSVRGTVNAGNAEVESASGHQIRVVVSTMGRIRLCSPDGEGYPACS